MVGDAAQLPGLSASAAPDHHAIGARLQKAIAGILHTHNVAIGNHRNADRALDRSNAAPVCPPLEELGARATMHRHHGHARSLGAPRKLRRIEALLVPAEPHLERDRNLNRRHHRLDEREGMVEIAHERRTREAARHLLGGAAHVDVDNVGAKRLGDAGSLGHPAGLTPGELDDKGAGGIALAACFELRLWPLVGKGLAGDHLRDHEGRAKTARKAAKRQVADPRHGRKQHVVRKRHWADTDCRRPRRRATHRCFALRLVCRRLVAHILCIPLGCLQNRQKRAVWEGLARGCGGRQAVPAAAPREVGGGKSSRASLWRPVGGIDRVAIAPDAS